MSYFDTATLAASFNRRVAPGEDFLNALFPNVVQSDAETIVIDDVLDDERIAAYVSPDVETPEGEKLEREVRDYRPTYVKERDTIKPATGLVRRAGEPLMGTEGAAGDRFFQAVDEQLDAHHNRITRREIVQANQVIQSSRVTVDGPHAAPRVINFNRDASLSGAYSGGTAWDAANYSIVDNLEARANAMGDIGGGLARDLILGGGAVGIFRKNEEIRENLDIRRAADADLQLGPIASGKKNVLSRVGQIGDFTVWKYQQSYMTAGGRVQMFPSMGSSLIDIDEFFGLRAYGAVLDTKAGLQALPRFAKVFDVEDPSATVALTQASPLLIPGNINACDFFTVA